MDDLVGIQVRLLGEAEVVAGNERIIASEKAVADESKAASDESAAAAKAASAEEVKASKAAQAERDAAVKSLKRQKTATKELGVGMTKYITGAAIGIGAASVYMAANFQRQMNLIATDAGGSRKEVQGLSVDVKNLARETQYGPTELAEALFHIESSGYRGAKAMKVLRESTNLATAGNSDLESTTYGLISAQKALYGHGSVSEVKKTAAELNEIVSHGDIRLEELVAGMGSGLIEKAVEAGVSLRSVGSALDVMTARGIPAQRASYALGFIFSKLVPYTEKASEAFERLGIGQEELSKAARSKGGWPAMIDLLKSKLKGLTDAQKQIDISEMFGGGRMDVAVLASIQNTEDLHKNYRELDGNVQEYNKHVHEGKTQPLIEMKQAVSNVKTDLIELGEALIPVVVPAIHDLGKFAGSASHFMDGLSGSTKGVIGEAIALAAVIGPLILLGGKLEKAWVGIKTFGALGGLAKSTTAEEGVASAGSNLGARVGMGGLLAGGGLIATNAASSAVGGKLGGWINDVGTGASVGAGVGALGGPVGALVGAGVGASVGSVVSIVHSLNQGEKALSITQLRLARDSKVVASGMKEQRQAGRSLITAEDRVQTASAKTHRVSHLVAKARREVTAAVRAYGPHSLGAVEAEGHLSDAIKRHVNALHKLKQAEKLRGVEASEYKTLARTNVLNERNEINVLQAKSAHLNNEYTALKKSGAGQQEVTAKAKQATAANSRLNTAQGKLSETLLEAAHSVGPAYSKWLRHANRELLEAGSQMGAFNEKVEEFGQITRETGIGGPLGQILAGGNEPSAASTEHGLNLGGGGGHKNKKGKAAADLLVRPGSNAWSALNRPPVGGGNRPRARGDRHTTHVTIPVKLGKRTIAEVNAEVVREEESHL